MDDAMSVRCSQGVGDFNPQFQDLFHRKWPSHDHVLEGFTFQAFYCNEQSAIGLVDFMYRADVGGGEGRRGAGLAAKALQGWWFARKIMRGRVQGLSRCQ